MKYNFSFKKHFPFPVQLILFWLFLFFIFRLVFFISYYSIFNGNSSHILYGLVFAGIRIDLAMTAYLIALPTLIWLLFMYTEKRIFINLINYYHYLIIPLICTILLANIGLYGSWGTLINRRLLLYLQHPSEIMHFMDTWKLIALPIAIAFIAFIFIRLYKKVISFSFNFSKRIYQNAFCILLFPVVLLFMRGGWQLVPINESAAAYSFSTSNNHLAINPAFYFFHSASEYFFINTKFQYFTPNEAQQIVDDYLLQETNLISDSVLTTSRPNIIIILLESWTADLLASNQELKDVIPFTDSLIREGIYFKNAYASGYRTDQGLVSVLSGYPSQPDNTIISYPAKTEKLPSISRQLREENYATSFFYGGDIEFANMKMYLSQQGFDVIKDKTSFSPEEYNSKWGAHDGHVFNKQIEYLKTEQEPFLSCLLTLSTHEPFDVPISTPFNGSEEREKFKKAAWYTDKCLRDYINTAKQQSWFANTVFIFTADHGHYLPLHRDMTRPESKKIVFFLYGDVLHKSYKGKQIDKVIAQNDIPATIANFVGLKNIYPFSRNVFKSKNGFAFYCNENAAGVVCENGLFTFYFDNNNKLDSLSLENLTKAYLQTTYADFVNK